MFNIFKSKNQKTNSKIEKLESAQLSKVIGGGEPVRGSGVALEQIPGGWVPPIKG